MFGNDYQMAYFFEKANGIEFLTKLRMKNIIFLFVKLS